MTELPLIGIVLLVIAISSVIAVTIAMLFTITASSDLDRYTKSKAVKNVIYLEDYHDKKKIKEDEK